MPKPVVVTDKIHELLVSETANLGLHKIEGVAHVIFMLGLTDPAYRAKVAEMSRYLGDHGSTTLEKKGL